MDASSSLTFGVRSLSETRLFHPPTYVATRFLLESVACEPSSAWTKSAILRRYPLEPAARLFEFRRFKKKSTIGTIEYREFSAPSPFTSLAEAVVLDELSKSKVFEKQKSVYSYNWPSTPRCPYNFDHYLQGYNKRNSDILCALRAFPGSVAIVTDIEKFYPTIPHDVVRDRFTQRITDSSFERATHEASLVLFEQLLLRSNNNRGIATGPEFSHVIGDIALAHVDNHFSHRLPGRYFRYVDDIIFVVGQH